MNQTLFKEQTGTDYLIFKNAKYTLNKWTENTYEQTLLCQYQSRLQENISVYFTTLDHHHIEVKPVVPLMTEKIRVEISEVVNQIATIIQTNLIFSTKIPNSSLEFVYSDLLIDDFESYHSRQSNSYLFPYKKEILQTYNYLNQSCLEEKAYDTKRKLVLFGKDGRVLSKFLELMNIVEIQYSQEQLLTIISFKNDNLHYCFHIQYFKQLFNDLGYTCHFLDNSITQSMIHKRNFLRKGGIYDGLQNHFSI